MIVVPRESQQPETHRSLPRKYLALFFVLFLLAAIVAILVFGFLFGHWHQGLARSASRVLPVPAASVEGGIVWYRDVVELAAAFEASKDGADSYASAFDEALEVAVERKHMEQLADYLGVVVTDDEIQAYEVEEGSLNEFLDFVGWSVKDYRKHVVRPLLISQHSEDAVYKADDYQLAALARAEKLYDDIELGIDFGDLARMYSDDISSEYNGDIGYFGKDDIYEGLESVFDLEVNEVSGVLDGGEYFAIVKVYDSIEDDGEVLLALKIITVGKAGLDEVMEEFSRGREVKFYVR
ncbi:MAG: peptidylprolyl isomerase [bacterium]